MDEDNRNNVPEIDEHKETPPEDSDPMPQGYNNNYNSNNYNSYNNYNDGRGNNGVPPPQQPPQYGSTPQDENGRIPYGQPRNFPNGDGTNGNYGQPYNNYPPVGYNQNDYDRNDPNNYSRYQYGGYNGQYGYYPNQYENPYAGYGPRPSQGLAVGSLVCGILGIVLFIFGFLFPPLFLLPIVGLVLGIVHKVKGIPFGRGMSTAGIITSIIGMIMPVALIVILIANWASVMGSIPDMMDYIKQHDPESYEQIYEQYADEHPEFFSKDAEPKQEQ